VLRPVYPQRSDVSTEAPSSAASGEPVVGTDVRAEPGASDAGTDLRAEPESSAAPDRPVGPDPAAPDPEPTGSAPVPGRWAARALTLLWFVLIAGVTAALHLLAALRPAAPVATLGESRLAVVTMVERGLELAVDPLPLGDRLAAIQLAVVQLLLPLTGVPVVDAARWACLALGAVAALLAWPVLRGLGVTAPAAAVGVGLVGAAMPAVTLHAGISAGAPAAVWLMVAAWFAVRQWGRAAAVAALVTVLTAPLAGAALLAMAAHLVLGRVVRVPDPLRLPFGGLLGVGAIAVAGTVVGAGPLAGQAGPLISNGVAVAGVVVGLIIVGLTWTSTGWLRPVLTATVPLLLVALVPGPSRAAAALLVAPLLAVAAGLLVDQLVERVPGAEPAVVALLVIVLVPTALTFGQRTPPPSGANALITWSTTQPAAGTVIRADDLDRAELLLAGFPAAQLRGPHDPPVPGELRLVADRPTGAETGPEPAGCPVQAVMAGVARGTGGAPGVICRTDGGAEAVAAEGVRRIRLGTALAANPALQLSPAAVATLRMGQVDPRLMLVLAAMTTAHRVEVGDFPAAELDSSAVPRRQVLLTAIDDGPPASSELLRTWLNAQQSPFRPSAIQSNGTALLVGYPAPPISGLLPE
jgi:hypothetical protein